MLDRKGAPSLYLPILETQGGGVDVWINQKENQTHPAAKYATRVGYPDGEGENAPKSKNPTLPHKTREGWDTRTPGWGTLYWLDLLPTEEIPTSGRMFIRHRHSTSERPSVSECLGD